MNYTKEALDSLEAQRSLAYEKYLEICESLVMRHYQSERAKEFTTQGLGRRLRLLVRCIDAVFEKLPPEKVDPFYPDSVDLLDATLFLQAFVFNTSGCIDNLAHIWVEEKGVTRNGEPLPNAQIGFHRKKKTVWHSLSNTFQEYLDGHVKWLNYVKNFRDALGHQLAVYIPAYCVDNTRSHEYEQIENAYWNAVLRKDNLEADGLLQQQLSMASFRPVAIHSFHQTSDIMWIHSQMIYDFKVVTEISEKLLAELG